MREAGLTRGLPPLRREEVKRSAGVHEAASHELVAGSGLGAGGLERRFCFCFCFHFVGRVGGQPGVDQLTAEVWGLVGEVIQERGRADSGESKDSRQNDAKPKGRFG